MAESMELGDALKVMDEAGQRPDGFLIFRIQELSQQWISMMSAGLLNSVLKLMNLTMN